MTRAWWSASGPSMQDVLVVDRAKLVQLVAGMRVRELAQLAGTSVDAVVSRIVIAGKFPTFPGLREHGNPATRRWEPNATTTGPEAEAEPMPELQSETEPQLEPMPELRFEPEPELGRLLGRVTRRELGAIIDRWVLGRVLMACEWNITHAADRLEVNRKTVRLRWAKVRRPAVGASMAKLASSEPLTDMPTGPSLTEPLEQGASYREIHRVVDRLTVAHALRDKNGNITRSATSLGMSRKTLRRVRDEAAALVCEGLER